MNPRVSGSAHPSTTRESVFSIRVIGGQFSSRFFFLGVLGVLAFTSTRCEMNRTTTTKTPATAPAPSAAAAAAPATTSPSGAVVSNAGYDVTPLGDAEVNELAKSLTA